MLPSVSLELEQEESTLTWGGGRVGRWSVGGRCNGEGVEPGKRVDPVAKESGVAEGATDSV